MEQEYKILLNGNKISNQTYSSLHVDLHIGVDGWL